MTDLHARLAEEQLLAKLREKARVKRGVFQTPSQKIYESIVNDMEKALAEVRGLVAKMPHDPQGGLPEGPCAKWCWHCKLQQHVHDLETQLREMVASAEASALERAAQAFNPLSNSGITKYDFRYIQVKIRALGGRGL